MKPKVAVLMSTYNGEKYIKEQIESILFQEGVDVILLIRDDGSSDNTLNIIGSFTDVHQNILLEKGKNCGAAQSFIELIYHAPEADYYAFSDQDDVWEPDKLRCAIEKIPHRDRPALYHGLAGRVDANLNPLSNKAYTPKSTFPASLLTSATGCTMVFNNSLMSILKQYKPSHISMHDAWVYRVCYAFSGDVFYDKTSHMKYRQHGNNVSGGDMSFVQKVRRQLQTNKNVRLETGRELYKGYRDSIPPQNKTILEMFVFYPDSIKNRIRIVLSNAFTTNSIKTNIQFKLLFLFGFI